MTNTIRGADIVMRALERAGIRTVFTLSGNHIMSLFDAALETRLDLVHVRQEAAAVHMADAWARLTGEPGVAMVTGGPGHANAAAALFTALGAESPVVLLSGHAATWELGRGGFQELRQADMAAPVAKASWTATATETLGADIVRALHLAASGRPGPVHLSLPSDVLDREIDTPAGLDQFAPAPVVLPDPTAAAIAVLLGGAARPLVIAGPQLANRVGRALLSRLEAATGIPAIIMESPRGLKDATLGAVAEVARRADLVLLLGKALDFTLRFGEAPAFDGACRWIVVEPDGAILGRAAATLGPRLAFGCVADTRPAAESLIRHAVRRDDARLAEARRLLDNRPAAWSDLTSRSSGKVHPAEVFRALKSFVERDPDTVLILDGGEFAQWGQSMLRNDRRIIPGVAGSIGASLPFACAARLAEPKAPVFAVLGDGTFGFHMAEFETAARRNLPFVAIVGTDARWNAEHNLQLRDYGPDRAHGCELLPVRYDLAAAALGGHGELVESAAELPGAVERALDSGKPACINVMIESTAAPRVPRT